MTGAAWLDRGAQVGFVWTLLPDGFGGLIPGWVEVETIELPDDDEGEST